MIRTLFKPAIILLCVALLPLAAGSALAQGHSQSLDQALFFALVKGDIGGMAVVRDKGADVNATLLSAGLDAEKLFGPLVDDLLATDADYDTWPILTWAVYLQNIEAVRVLVKSRAYVNAQDGDMTTPLHWAAWTGNYPIVRFLLENGANAQLQDRKGRLPLDWAILNGQQDVIRILPSRIKINDSDRDGVPDEIDECPNTPYGAMVDERGCWVAAYANYFDFNKAYVKQRYRPFIKRAAQVLQKHPDIEVIVVGHTDHIGSDEYNMKLGMRRAQAVADLLVKYGVAESRLTVESKGESEPIDTNNTSKGRAKNRRVEIHVKEPVTGGNM